MTTISHLSAARLHRAAELQTNIEALQAELANVLGGTPSPVVAETAVAPPAAAAAPVAAAPKKGQLTAAGRAKIIAASRAYWAMVRAGAKATAAKPIAAKAPAKQKGAISPAGRAKLVAIAKARWAKNKASGKSQL